jgi:hypothetical protein
VFANVQLIPAQDDVIVWLWSNDDMFLAKSAYNAFFNGMTWVLTKTKIWHFWVSYRCKFHYVACIEEHVMGG